MPTDRKIILSTASRNFSGSMAGSTTRMLTPDNEDPVTDVMVLDTFFQPTPETVYAQGYTLHAGGEQRQEEDFGGGLDPAQKWFVAKPFVSAPGYVVAEQAEVMQWDDSAGDVTAVSFVAQGSPYTTPGVGSTSTLTVLDTTNFTVSSTVLLYLPGAGMHEITAIPSGTTLTVKNRGIPAACVSMGD